MKKVVAIIVLSALSAISASYAIWARNIRNHELKNLGRFHGKDSRIFKLSSKWMGSSCVFSFRFAGSSGALVLLAAAIYVAIYD